MGTPRPPIARTVVARWLACGLTVSIAAAGTRADPSPFTDPGPAPVVATVPPGPGPAAAATPELTVDVAPKPLPAGAVAQDWPCFLGPNHNVTSGETRLLASFPPAGPPLAWSFQKGTGYSAPAIAAGRLVLFHRLANREVVDCLDPETGKRFWQFAYPTTYRDRYGYCDGPRCAPVIDGDSVYTFGAEGKLHCLSMSGGQVRWQRDLLSEFKVEQNFFGVGATPLVEGNQLIINLGAPGGPCVAAFDKATGRLAWGAGREWGPSYASPIPAVVHGKRRVFVFAGGESRPATGGLLCIDPADGHVDFTFKWRGRRYESVNASSPRVVGDRVFLSECYGRGSVMLDIAPDLTAAKPLWTDENFGTHFMTVVEKDGYLYGVHGHGPLDSPTVCLNAETGAEQWRTEPEWEETIRRGGEERKEKLNLARGSFLLAEGKILALGEYGHLLWLDPSPQGYRELSRAWLFSAGETWTAPVLSHGLLYVCQNERDAMHNVGPRLLCYDFRADK